MTCRPLSSETIACLRNCTLSQHGTYEGTRFVRCVPHAPGVRRLPENEALAQAERVVAEINEPDVIVSWHEQYGPYVRVANTSDAYRLICHMKS